VVGRLICVGATADLPGGYPGARLGRERQGKTMSDRLITSQWMTTDRPYWSVYANAVSRLCCAFAVVLTLMVVGPGTGPSSGTVIWASGTSLQTLSLPLPRCGDGKCESTETPTNCPADCQLVP
jgi:hypothetical protein